MKADTIKHSVYAAIALAFASFGDAFLYAFLPVNHEMVGVPVAWIGVLLSVNRFVRIFSNTAMVHVFSNHGLKSVTVVAVVAAIVSTLGYWIASTVLVWLVCRIVWGLSFSAMRISTLGYALRNEKVGTALGVSRSLQEAGPMLALLLAPFLLNEFNGPKVFLVLAAMSLPALWFAMRLPIDAERTNVPHTRWTLRVPSLSNAITLITAIIIDGVIVIVLGILFLRHHADLSLLAATSLAALYLGYRRVCLVILSPAGGWIADHFGLRKVFNGSLLLVAAGLVMIASGLVASGCVVLFTFYSICAAVTPGVVHEQSSGSLMGVARNATWRDIGAAIGTLIGGFLINSSFLNGIFFLSAGLLFILFALHAGMGRSVASFYSYGNSKHL